MTMLATLVIIACLLIVVDAADTTIASTRARSLLKKRESRLTFYAPPLPSSSILAGTKSIVTSYAGLKAAFKRINAREVKVLGDLAELEQKTTTTTSTAAAATTVALVNTMKQLEDVRRAAPASTWISMLGIWPQCISSVPSEMLRCREAFAARLPTSSVVAAASLSPTETESLMCNYNELRIEPTSFRLDDEEECEKALTRAKSPAAAASMTSARWEIIVARGRKSMRRNDDEQGAEESDHDDETSRSSRTGMRPQDFVEEVSSCSSSRTKSRVGQVGRTVVVAVVGEPATFVRRSFLLVSVKADREEVEKYWFAHHFLLGSGNVKREERESIKKIARFVFESIRFAFEDRNGKSVGGLRARSFQIIEIETTSNAATGTVLLTKTEAINPKISTADEEAWDGLASLLVKWSSSSSSRREFGSHDDDNVAGGWSLLYDGEADVRPYDPCVEFSRSRWPIRRSDEELLVSDEVEEENGAGTELPEKFTQPDCPSKMRPFGSLLSCSSLGWTATVVGEKSTPALSSSSLSKKSKKAITSPQSQSSDLPVPYSYSKYFRELKVCAASAVVPLEIRARASALGLPAPLSCAKPSSWSQARAFCVAAGARLCTFPELSLLGLTAGTGCDADARRVWSSTRCGDEGGYMTAVGNPQVDSNVEGIKPKCVRAGASLPPALARCCADEGGPPVCLDDDDERLYYRPASSDKGGVEEVGCREGERETGSLLGCAELRFKYAGGKKAYGSSSSLSSSEDASGISRDEGGDEKNRARGRVCGTDRLGRVCTGLQTYAEVREACAKRGARMCEAEEVERVVLTAGTEPCSWEDVGMWSHTPCERKDVDDLNSYGPGRGRVAIGLGKSKKCLPEDDTTTALLACCGDEGGRRCEKEEGS